MKHRPDGWTVIWLAAALVVVYLVTRVKLWWLP